MPTRCLPTYVWDFSLELIFGKGIRTATFQFSESGGSVNSPNLFTELPFMLKSLPNPWFTELPPPFSLKSSCFSLNIASSSPSPKSAPKQKPTSLWQRPTWHRPSTTSNLPMCAWSFLAGQKISIQHHVVAQPSMWNTEGKLSGCNSPNPRKRPVCGPKTPISLRPHTGWKREFSVKKSPFPLCSLAEKRIFLTENSIFQDVGKWFFFWPRKPLFQKLGIRGVSGVGGIPTLWGIPKPLHLKPGHLKMAFFSARRRLDGAFSV